MPEHAVRSLSDYLRQGSEDDATRTDADLLRRFIEANDHRAFEALLGRHGPMVFVTARRLVRNATDAEDVFRAAFLSLARRAGTIRRGCTQERPAHVVAFSTDAPGPPVGVIG